jgi:hypothetical protein
MIVKIVILVAVASVISFLLGRFSKTFRVIELVDTFFPNKGRSDAQIVQDAVMKLKNEIVQCGAVTYKELENGNIEVSLKVLV